MTQTIWIADRKTGRREVPGHTFTHEVQDEKFEFTWHRVGSASPTISHARSGFRICDVQPEDREAGGSWIAAARHAIDRTVLRNGPARVRSILAGAPDLPALIAPEN